MTQENVLLPVFDHRLRVFNQVLRECAIVVAMLMT